uniref:Uncharacterized protein n=1 Tax=Meloidogyne enterolobii TaxID=390850 RepID=A0A6V7WI39_MELEN|nr:unnamed protein product [Meloidogyne enterolobii]
MMNILLIHSSAYYNNNNYSSKKLFFFFILFNLNISLINSKICLSSLNEENEETKSLTKSIKICPDFKDEPEEIACCPSQITSGSFFCCTEQHKNELESELASEARKKFISGHIPELVLLILALIFLLFICCSYLCRRTRFCPLLHRRKASSNSNILIGRSTCSAADSAEFSCRPQFNNAQQQQQRRSFQRPYHHYQIASSYQQQQQQASSRPLFNSTINNFEKECEPPPPPPQQPPPPYSSVIASAPTASLFSFESRQNRLNTQREQQQRASVVKEEDEEEEGEEEQEDVEITSQN